MALIGFKTKTYYFLRVLISYTYLLLAAANCLSPEFAEAQIPISPNKTDTQGKRHGLWTILLGGDLKPTTDSSAAFYYRLVNYNDDRPLGTVRDYYKNGRLQFTGRMVEDRPKEILDGPVTWYSRYGLKEAQAVFNNGLLNGQITFFYTDGSIISDTYLALNSKGRQWRQVGKPNEALPFVEKAFIVCKNDISRGRIFYAEALKNLASLYFELGNYSKAEPLYIEAVELSARIFGRQHKNYTSSLNDLASLYLATADYLNAEALLLEQKNILANGMDQLDYASSLNALAALYFEKADYAKTVALLKEATEIVKKALGKEHTLYASSLNSLGSVYMAMGNNSIAEPLFLEAKGISARVSGTEGRPYALSLNNLAVQYYNIGNYSEAEPLFLEAIRVREKVLGKQHPDLAQSLIDLAHLYYTLGNFSEAEPLLLKAKEIQENALGKQHPKYAGSLYDLSVLYEAMGKPQAEVFYLEIVNIMTSAVGEEHPSYAACLNNLARYYQIIGNPKAEALYLKSIDIMKRTKGKEHVEYARALTNLALLYKTMGNPKAESLYLEAINIIATTLGKEHPDYAAALHGLAWVYLTLEKSSKAEPFYLEAIAYQQRHLSRYFPSLSENEKQRYYLHNEIAFLRFEMLCLDRYVHNPALLSQLYNLKLVTKGILFNASNKMRHRILNSNDKDLITFFNEWQSKKDFLAKVYQMPLTEQQKIGINQKKLEEEANSLEKLLSLKSEVFASATDSKPHRWEDVRDKLQDGEVAVEIIKTQRRIVGVLSGDVYAALVVTPQTQAYPDIVVLENGYDLENKYSKYYSNAIMSKIRDQISYNQYWKPISDKLKGARKVYFSADGVYNQINLNTLYNPATRKYVMDEIAVQLVTSTRDLITQNKNAKIEIKDATLFGYPNYNNFKPTKPDGEVQSLNGENIIELPGTKVEIETIEALLKQKNVPMHTYMFDEATEDEIKKLSTPQVLHIATHGFFYSDLPAAKENEPRFAGMETKKVVENPLLRSGLLFAGAKNASTQSRGGAEDGILYAYEAMGLDLDKTDLVVMSACETGLGITNAGEGVYGLQRAFQLAGAKSVLMSLWSVSDEATHELMVSFYQNWLSGVAPRDAFRTAQLSLRIKFPEPYYWGAFVMVGN